MIKLFTRYVISGFLSIVAQFGILSFLVEQLSVRKTPASAIAYTLAAVINYFMLYHWTFKSVSRHRIIAFRFAFVMLLMLALNTFLFWLLVAQLGVWYFYGQYIASSVVALATFVLNKNFTFD